MEDADFLELQTIKLPCLLSTVEQNRVLLILSKPSTKPNSTLSLSIPSLQGAFSYIIDRTETQSGRNAMILVDQNFTKVTYLLTSL